MNRIWLASGLSGFALVLVGLSAVRAADAPIRTLQTPSGVAFGILGDKPSAPAPTLFVFANDLKNTLKNTDYNRAGMILAEKGFLCVALELPCHGKEHQGEEPEGLNGWAARLEKGDGLVPGFTKKVSDVLDFLIKEGYTDPARVAACGTSRGGFIALHVAAAEPRIKYVAAFAPVTDLLALREFARMDKHEPTKALALAHHADKLAGRAVWLCIGNYDDRVNTDQAIAFTRKVVEASIRQKKPANVELHVMPSLGHSIHPTAHQEVAEWVLKQMKQDGK